MLVYFAQTDGAIIENLTLENSVIACKTSNVWTH